MEDQVVIKSLFNKVGVIAIAGDVNEAKSNLLYHIIETLKTDSTYKLYYYGLRNDIKDSKILTQRIYSTGEMENIRDSVIIIDELSSLVDLTNNKLKKL